MVPDKKYVPIDADIYKKTNDSDSVDHRIVMESLAQLQFEKRDTAIQKEALNLRARPLTSMGMASPSMMAPYQEYVTPMYIKGSSGYPHMQSWYPLYAPMSPESHMGSHGMDVRNQHHTLTPDMGPRNAAMAYSMVYQPVGMVPSQQWVGYGHHSNVGAQEALRQQQHQQQSVPRGKTKAQPKSTKKYPVPLRISCSEYESKKEEFRVECDKCKSLELMSKNLLEAERAKGRPSLHQLTVLKSTLQTPKFTKEFVQNLPPIYLIECGMEYEGSKALQKVMQDNAGNKALIAELHKALLPFMTELSLDVFGNYIVQQFLTLGDDDIKSSIGSILKKRAISLSVHLYGCRVIQCGINNLSQEDRQDLCDIIEPFTLLFVESPNANHVIQSILRIRNEHRPSSLTSIHAVICQHAAILAEHDFGCRVLQAALESQISSELELQTIKLLAPKFAELTQHEHGNFVVQQLVESDLHGAREMVLVSILKSSIFVHSCHKYASNLIEKLLLHGSQPQREQIIRAILIESDSISDSPGRAHAAIAKLTADKYGNYVMQMALEVAAPLEKQLLLSYLSEHSNFLRDSTYGKHLLSYLQ